MAPLKIKNIKLVEIKDEKEKKRIAKNVLSQLKPWFYKTAQIEYSKETANKNFFAISNEKEIIGFVSVQSNNQYTAEIHVMGILKRYHNQGAGESAIKKISQKLKGEKYQILIVKTLSEKVKYKPYEKTRNFYCKCGFIPIGVFEEIWDKRNPCLIMIKIL